MSEIRVDTISEKTSANGVSIDGVTIKDGGIVATAASTITLAGTGDNLTLASTDAGASAAPNLRLYRNSSSPADDDLSGTIDFEWRNDNSQDVVGFQISNFCRDVSDGVEENIVQFYNMFNGTLTEFLRVDSQSDQSVVTFNELSNDIDFRVESDGRTHAFVVDAGTNTTMIGTSETDFHSNADDLIIGTGSGHKGITIFTGNDSIGNLNFADGTLSAGASDRGAVKYDHNTDDMIFNTSAAEVLRLYDLKVATNGETAADVTDGGLTLNQGANDAKILSFKSSDVAHGITNEAETDTYFNIKKANGPKGGIRMDALNEQGNETLNMVALYNNTGGEIDTTTSGSGNGCVRIGINKYNDADGDGAANQASPDAANIFTVQNYTGTQFIVKGNGAIHSNAAADTFDTYEDAELVRAFDLTHGKGVIASQFDKHVRYNHEALAEAELVGREEDGTPNMFMNVTGFVQLHNGAIWQQYEKTQRLTNAMYELAKAAVGEDKANEILEQNEIKLLN